MSRPIDRLAESVRLQSSAAQRRAILDEAALEALTLLRSACVPE